MALKMKISDGSTSNILYLDSGSGIGGGQRSLLLLLSLLDRARFTPFVGCLGGSRFAAEIEKTGAYLLPLPLPAAHNKTDKTKRFTFGDLVADFRQFGVIVKLHRLVRQHRIDLIHANSLSVALLGGVVARLNGIPILMHKRYATSYGVLDRLCERLLHRVILVSEATRWGFAAPEKQTLIYNGVDLETFQASSAEVETFRAEVLPGVSRSSFLMGVVTRITPEKGIHFLIRAIAALKGEVDAKLLIVGGPYFEKDVSYMEDLKREVADLGIEDSVVFTGFLSDTRIVTSLLDVVLVPSIIPEACPRTIIEAMAVGRPVIATPLGGSKELVTAETGILVPPEDASAIAGAVRTLSSDRGRLEQMRRAARTRGETLFSSERNTALTEAVYAELLGSGGDSQAPGP